MTEEQVRMFCLNNGINASPIGTPLHVLDPTELPASVRKFVADDGSYAGSGESDNPEAGDLPNANPSETQEAEEGDEGQQLKGRLPADFPHFKELEAAGITSYGKLRGLGGDYSSIAGIGPAKGAEIDEALGASGE